MPESWRTQLAAIAAQYGDPDLVNSTMKACLQRRAFLFSAKDDDGWVVLQPISHSNSVLVLAAFCSGHNAIERYQDNICCLSKAIGCSSIHFKTRRLGFRRKLKSSQWRRSVATDGADLWELHHG